MLKQTTLTMAAVAYSGLAYASPNDLEDVEVIELEDGLYSTGAEYCWQNIVLEGDQIYIEHTDARRRCSIRGHVQIGVQREIAADEGQNMIMPIYDTPDGDAEVIDLEYVRRCSARPERDMCEGVIDPETRKLLPGVNMGDLVQRYASYKTIGSTAYLVEHTYTIESADSSNQPLNFILRKKVDSVLFTKRY